jgi:type I restriction enzyme, S subunit
VNRTSLDAVLLSLESGARPKGGARSDSGDIPSLGGEHVSADGGFDFTNVKRIPRSFFEAMRGGRIAVGDILVVKDGATTGKTSLVREDFPFAEAAVNEHVFCLRVDPDKASPAYVYHFLYSSRGQEEIQLDFRGATVGGISREFASKIALPFPPLAQQRRIAEVLDRAEALRTKRRACIAQLDTLTQSIFVDMFGDPAKNPKRWSQTLLNELISVGPQNGLYRPAGDYGSGTPIVRIDAFYDGQLTNLASLKRVRISTREQALYALREGDIVINRVNSREYLGKSALIPALNERTVFESNMMRFGVDRAILDPGYLIQYLQTGFVRNHILRSAKDAVNQSSINQQDVKALPVIVPPLALQQLFTQRLAARDRLKVTNDASFASLEALFASLQDRAFRGEL